MRSVWPPAGAPRNAARLDASGRPVALPDDGIVPPELAPPGLPLRLLEVPENPYGAGEREALRDEAG